MHAKTDSSKLGKSNSHSPLRRGSRLDHLSGPSGRDGSSRTWAQTKETLCSGGDLVLNSWAQYSATICILASANAATRALLCSCRSVKCPCAAAATVVVGAGAGEDAAAAVIYLRASRWMIENFATDSTEYTLEPSTHFSTHLWHFRMPPVNFIGVIK